MSSSKKIDLYRDFAAGVYLSEAPSPPKFLFGVVKHYYYYLKCLFRNFYGILQFTLFFMDRYCVRITVLTVLKNL